MQPKGYSSEAITRADAEFLSLGTVDVWGWKFSVVADSPARGRMCSSISGLCSLEAGSILSLPHPHPAEL